MHSDFQLGVWRVQPQLNHLGCEQKTFRLEPKMMEVLVCLAQRSGEVVSKEQLVQEVWRDTFVSDDVLIRCVSELRKVFGDSVAKPAFIETIPKKGYRLLVPVTPVSAPDLPRDGIGNELVDSIAILPFENTGHHPDMEYLSDGITETIINNLSQLDRLRVLPRTIVFRYKGKTIDPAKVGRELRVRVVVTGHVVQRGDRLVIGAELIDTAKESQVWGQTYDRRPDDILSIQDEIASEISSKLRVRLTDAERNRLTRRGTQSSEAYFLQLKALYWANKWTAEGIQKGLGYARQAIEADPGYALAYAILAKVFALMGFFGDVPPMDAFPRAKAAAQHALAIDDTLAGAHAVLGFAGLVFDWDFASAELEAQRALELDPESVWGHYLQSLWCLARGDFEKAISQARRALALDSLMSPLSYYLGATLYFARRYDDAIEQLKRARELDPSFSYTSHLLAVVYAQNGLPGKAMAEAEEFLALSESNLMSRATLGVVSAVIGQQSIARGVLEELKSHGGTNNTLAAYRSAAICALLGDLDNAFEWLGRACEGRAGPLIYLKVEPGFENLHGDPRFVDLLRRIGLSS
jgi:TolB-like protein/Tfp pilus assembly protein PilF